MNPALPQARFDDGCSLDAAGAARARTAAAPLPVAGRGLVSPTVRCRETASALPLGTAAGPASAGLDVGCRRDRTLEELSVESRTPWRCGRRTPRPLRTAGSRCSRGARAWADGWTRPHRCRAGRSPPWSRRSYGPSWSGCQRHRVGLLLDRRPAVGRHRVHRPCRTMEHAPASGARPPHRYRRSLRTITRQVHPRVALGGLPAAFGTTARLRSRSFTLNTFSGRRGTRRDRKGPAGSREVAGSRARSRWKSQGLEGLISSPRTLFCEIAHDGVADPSEQAQPPAAARPVRNKCAGIPYSFDIQPSANHRPSHATSHTSNTPRRAMLHWN